ncbi:sigma-E processing peptidase SpoIIGA [Anaerosalibacter massiliensis]|uniref:Sporulation sigma-E factor-processing peptidase n=1 Tax=Anaerosalibacter massiliensis TaxID=1347392 RepID=A0A9X2S440_9FIRM|nr:sigma-E processing peptidase SpoIIGA [Anaerosalibacter massiliensis]MCR2042884.1 sigma-E processing peptidase SpoIIGA [Anaerosalibacter massiliensis]
MYIYAEYLILENAIINYIILYVTKKITRTETSKFRLIMAAFIGAIYTLVVFFPSLKFMVKFTVKISMSVLIIIVAFNPEKFSDFIRLLSMFYVTAFVFAGATFALFYVINGKFSVYNGVFYITDFPVKFLILGVCTSFILIKYVFSYLQIKLGKKDILTNIIINLNNKKANIVALVDTGNSLKEPISQRPVIIVEFFAIKDLLPEKVQRLFMNNDDFDLDIVTDIMLESIDEINLRVIPFKAIGTESGMLLGFSPDEILIVDEFVEKKIEEEIVVGIYNNKLSNDNKYKGLLNPEILY